MGRYIPRKTTTRKAVPTVFCPRCDKPFNTHISRVENMKVLRAHVRKVHREDDDVLEQLFD